MHPFERFFPQAEPPSSFGRRTPGAFGGGGYKATVEERREAARRARNARKRQRAKGRK